MASQDLSIKACSATLLTLPAELRLQIAELALEQCLTAGLLPRHQSTRLSDYMDRYKPSRNLSLLSVCRQFRQDFTTLAYNKTRFTLPAVLLEEEATRIRELPLQRLQSIRRLALGPLLTHEPWERMALWDRYVYNEERLHLDELVFICSQDRKLANLSPSIQLLRRLQHVKVIRFLLYVQTSEEASQAYRYLVGAIMKEDHFQRYDAPGAPNIEATWWDWSFDPEESIIMLRAQNPRPVLLEEEYMSLMKPKVDALMAEAERAAGL